MLEKKKIKEEGKSLVHIFTSAALQIKNGEESLFFFPVYKCSFSHLISFLAKGCFRLIYIKWIKFQKHQCTIKHSSDILGILSMTIVKFLLIKLLKLEIRILSCRIHPNGLTSSLLLLINRNIFVKKLKHEQSQNISKANIMTVYHKP